MEQKEREPVRLEAPAGSESGRKTTERSQSQSHTTRKRFANLPEELKTLQQWVCWRWGKKKPNGKRDKIPVNPRTGQHASVSDSATWGAFNEAVAAVEQGRADGIGFVFTDTDSFSGTDLDGCRDPETGTVEPWALAIVERFPGAYWEVSPSAAGLHAIMRGSLPPGGRKQGQIEAYDRGRYFTMTGDFFAGEQFELSDYTTELAAWHADVFGKQESNSRDHTTGQANTQKITPEVIEALSYIPADDYDDWLRMGMASHAINPGAEGFNFWDTWSQKSVEKYEPGACEKKWRSFSADRENPVGVGTIFELAKQYGWQKSPHAPPVPLETTAGNGVSLWPEPQPLPEGLLPVPVLDERLIPDRFRAWLVDIAERMQCPLDYPTIGAIVALAGLVGRRVGIRPKRHDDWLVVPNLWGAIIGRPGLLKTPALAEVLKPLQRLEIQARQEYEQELERADIEKLTHKARREALEKLIREAVKKGVEPDQSKIEALSAHASAEPTLARYIVNDSTVEKLGVILNENPHGVLYFRDELTGFLRTLDKEGHENDRTFYLEAWNGTNSYTYDRIGRGTLYIGAACVSILGSIQPGPLAGYLRGAVKGRDEDDGLMQRFQLMVYPDDPGAWRNVDRWPDSRAKERAFKLFEQLSTLEPAAIQAHVFAEREIPFLRFSEEGQGFFNTWRAELEQKIRLPDHPVLEAHFSKYRSLMPSLALLFHLLAIIDTGTKGGVSLQAAQQAAAWCDYLEAHARRIYQSVTQRAPLAARLLAERIKAGKLPSPFPAHRVYRNDWAGLSTASDVEEAAEILEELGWLRSERVLAGSKGGRPRFHYWINPQLANKEGTA